jgi:hypothetical protein
MLALPGFAGSAFAVLIGCLVFLFALPSLGHQLDYGYVLSPAAGAFLFVLLGFEGALGAALAADCRRAGPGFAISGCLLSLSGFVALALVGEWVACFFVIVIAAISGAAWRWRKGASLLVFAGLAGFPIGQVAMTFLPYGWKTWAISGVLFVFCWLLFFTENDFRHLPLLHDGSASRQGGYFLYTLLSLVLIFLAIAALIHVPADGGPDVQGEVSAGIRDRTLGPWSLGTGSQISGMKECDCMNNSPTKATNQSLDCQGSWPKVLIIAPGDVRTFPRGEPVRFEASVCGKAPFRYIWRSSLDGVIGRTDTFESSNLSTGRHTVTLTITDSANFSATDTIELGIADPSVCSNVNPRPKYYPVDTPCQDTWPNATSQCQEFEVCHPDLDYIVADAISCCDGTPRPGSACAKALASSGGDKKRCRALYIIEAFGPEAGYMQGYALFKACCSGYPECTRTCGLGLAGTCAFRDGFNENVSNLSCRPEEWGLEAWRSDTNMSENSAVLGMFPTHATVNILHTGVCIDYAAALTTLLRKAGYNRTEALSTSSTGYDLPLLGNHPGHAYNLVLLPNDSKYHFVDTTGNGEGINLDGVPHYFWFTGCFLGQSVRIKVFDWWVRYCNKTDSISYNDAGDFKTPEKETICGCS